MDINDILKRMEQEQGLWSEDTSTLNLNLLAGIANALQVHNHIMIELYNMQEDKLDKIREAISKLKVK